MKNIFIHPLALVESKNIGDGTRVWAWTHILPDAFIGSNCNIGEQCFIENKVHIGKECTVKNGVAVYDGITLEDKVFIGPGVIFTNDKYPRSKEPWVMEKTMIRKGATIGAGAVIIGGVEIGEYAMIAAGAVVTKNIARFELVIGNPAKKRGYVCVCAKLLKEENKNYFFCSSCSRKYFFDTNTSILNLI